MVTVLRRYGMRFVIYLDDHEPAHVHVSGDGEARIDIKNLKTLSRWRMSDRDIHRAEAVIEENRQLLLDKWRQYHV